MLTKEEKLQKKVTNMKPTSCRRLIWYLPTINYMSKCNGTTSHLNSLWPAWDCLWKTVLINPNATSVVNLPRWIPHSLRHHLKEDNMEQQQIIQKTTEPSPWDSSSLCVWPNVIVESDDKPLESITHKPLAAAPSRLEIMILQLQRYDFIITHRPGKETQYLLLTHYQGSCCQKKEAVLVKVYSSAYSIQQLTSQWQDFTKSLWSRPLTHVDKGWMSWGEEMW